MCLLSKMAIVGIYSSNIMGVNYFHLTIGHLEEFQGKFLERPQPREFPLKWWWKVKRGSPRKPPNNSGFGIIGKFARNILIFFNQKIASIWSFLDIQGHRNWGLVWLNPQKHTIQTPNLRWYDWMFRVCLLSKEDVVTDLARPSGLALLRSAMPGASGPTVLWSDLEEKKIYGIDVAEENSTREVWVEGTRRVFFFGSGDFPKKKEEQREIFCFFLLRFFFL